MKTLIIREDTPEAKAFLEYARTLPFVEEENTEHVPGVPHTPEQLRESVGRAQEQRKQGLGLSQQEAFRKYDEMYKGQSGW